MFVKILLLSLISIQIEADFTFKNVEVTCDIENPTSNEIPFSTIVTTNRLKPHLPGDQGCYKIVIQHETIPILHRDSLAEINNTKLLFLENDNIEEIQPGAFRNVKIKEGVSLKSNKLKEIRSGALKGLQVPVLFLSFNSISYIYSDAFDNMTELESIHLDQNKIGFVDNQWFKNTPKLSKINLQHNNLRVVPFDAFGGLMMGRNRFGKAIGVDLSFNQIETVDSNALSSVRKLDFFSLAHNQLYVLPMEWLWNVQINILDISFNRITCLSVGLAGVGSTNFVDKNPWNCECLDEIKRNENKTFGKIIAISRSQECDNRMILQ